MSSPPSNNCGGRLSVRGNDMLHQFTGEIIIITMPKQSPKSAKSDDDNDTEDNNKCNSQQQQKW
jgi:hypothetical protein